ncbi:hypothetical protein HDK90DRAFT_495848, partial [Phyllosticta capitalensis]
MLLLFFLFFAIYISQRLPLLPCVLFSFSRLKFFFLGLSSIPSIHARRSVLFPATDVLQRERKMIKNRGLALVASFHGALRVSRKQNVYYMFCMQRTSTSLLHWAGAVVGAHSVMMDFSFEALLRLFWDGGFFSWIFVLRWAGLGASCD